MEKKRFYSKDIVKTPGVFYVTDDNDWAIALDSKYILIYVFGEDEINIMPHETWEEEDMDMFMLPDEGRLISDKEAIKTIFTREIYDSRQDSTVG